MFLPYYFVPPDSESSSSITSTGSTNSNFKIDSLYAPSPPESSFNCVALRIPPFFHFLPEIDSNCVVLKSPPFVKVICFTSYFFCEIEMMR